MWSHKTCVARGNQRLQNSISEWPWRSSRQNPLLWLGSTVVSNDHSCQYVVLPKDSSVWNLGSWVSHQLEPQRLFKGLCRLSPVGLVLLSAREAAHPPWSISLKHSVSPTASQNVNALSLCTLRKQVTICSLCQRSCNCEEQWLWVNNRIKLLPLMKLFWIF